MSTCDTNSTRPHTSSRAKREARTPALGTLCYRDLCENVNKQGQDGDEYLRSSTPEAPLQVLWHGLHLQEDGLDGESVGRGEKNPQQTV